MLTIRFNRTGKKNRVSYRIVLQEHTQAPGKRHIEILGSHDPHKKTTILKSERIAYWMGQGAQPSDVVYNLLISEGVIEGKKRPRKMPRPVVKEEVPAEETPAGTPQEEAETGNETPEEAAAEAEAIPEAAAEEPAVSTEEGEAEKSEA